jgi:NAD-dependent SIR2 family protein deacetylase
MGIVEHVITQNIDGLHKKAGVGLSGILEEVKKISG